MVRHKNTNVKRNKRCVSEVLTGSGRNYRNIDRKTSCEFCTSKSRFCARLVRVGQDIKFGFFPVHRVDGSDVAWDRLEFWIDVR
jgi:hypothetical protein